ncbi:MAG: hypothetical protein HYY61_01205 [Deltaproteobacteria bacterium]|nr:hypothetical protein [Deltaproteobacteria bacterium]
MQIDSSQMEQVEYLFNQSAKGNHVLFDPTDIKKALSAEKSFEKMKGDYLDTFDIKTLQKMRDLLDLLMSQPTVSEKRHFILNLSPDSKELLIKAYFNILDNTLFQNKDHIQ